MIQSYCGRGIGGAKRAWLHCSNRLHVNSFRTTHILVAEFRVSPSHRGLFLGRRELSGWFCQHLRFRVSRNSLAFHDSKVVSTRRNPFATQPRVSGPALDIAGTDPRKDQNDGDESSPRAFHGSFDGENPAASDSRNHERAVAEEEEEEDLEEELEENEEEFLSRGLVLNSQRAMQVGKRKMAAEGVDDSSEPFTVWPQVPGEPERWWRIPDFVGEVLPLPKHFNAHLEILYDKLGCRIHSRELLLRILSMGQVHKSFYLSKMPPSFKLRKLRRPLMSWQRLETVVGDDTDLMTFAEAHGEARLQLALLGDTVLNLAASLYLIRQHPLLSTGLITERRSQLVCNSNLARVWSTLLDLRELVLCDPPLSQSKKPSATTVLEFQMKACADTLEAYVGGLYVEKGLESALQCVETRLLPLLLLAEPTRNPVALLHERCVIVLQQKPDYKLIGIDNKNTPNESCRIRVYVKGLRLSTGIGKSQKLARRDAAEKALLKWPQVFGSAP